MKKRSNKKFEQSVTIALPKNEPRDGSPILPMRMMTLKTMSSNKLWECKGFFRMLKSDSLGEPSIVMQHTLLAIILCKFQY